MFLVVLLDTTKEATLEWTRYPYGPQTQTPGVMKTYETLKIIKFIIWIKLYRARKGKSLLIKAAFLLWFVYKLIWQQLNRNNIERKLKIKKVSLRLREWVLENGLAKKF